MKKSREDNVVRVVMTSGPESDVKLSKCGKEVKKKSELGVNGNVGCTGELC